eukprot:m.62016 g.62016  ORF g.62016 m.62016 type:complete len:388 (-) comp8058_c0_seq1:151-1314(-)
MNDLVLAILSDTITYPTPWQHTAFVVTIGMIPLLSVCALWGWSAVRNMVGKWTLRGVVLALMVAVLFDCVSVAQYPVPSKGAVVVTGASSGIGRAAAIALAEAGFTVWAGVRNERDAVAIQAQANSHESMQGRLMPLTIDVTKTDTIKAAVATVENAGLPVVALVNNAGVLGTILPVEILTVDTWRHVFDINVFGVVETTQHFLPLIRQAKGRIVNMGSTAGEIGGFPGSNPYTASKHALESISDAMRVELGHFGVSVSLIKPGGIETELFKKVIPGTASVPSDEEIGHVLNTGYGSDAVKALYADLVSVTMRMIRFGSTTKGILPSTAITDAAVVHAVTSPFPKARYTVGPDAILFLTLDRWLPDRVMDAVFNWVVFRDGWKLIYM